MLRIKHIFDGDYGCEEGLSDEKKVSVTLINESEEEKYISVKDKWLIRNNLDIGSYWPMETIEYGNYEASAVLIQPVGNHDLQGLEEEVEEIKKITNKKFQLIAVKIENWNYDLSPWKAPAVFGNEDFGEGASDTLTNIMNLFQDRSKQYYIGGYSLAGLFSLWAAYQTDTFQGVAAASPSVWLPNFTAYMKENKIKSRTVYLSLGDKEAKTKNPVMATVAERICECECILKDQGVRCMLEWNQGNHFKDPQIRMAKAFAWVLENGTA